MEAIECVFVECVRAKTMTTVIQLQDVSKTYSTTESGAQSESSVVTSVLVGASLQLDQGESVALLGASGSGKSTLLHCAGLLDSLDAGTRHLLGEDWTSPSANDAAEFRLRHVGFVFQFHHLIPELTALENVLLPASLAGGNGKKRALELLERVGLVNKANRYPWALSGGEAQRVAVARALVNQPELVLTDEATGNLDRTRSFEVVELLLSLCRDFGTALLSVTHDEELAMRYSKQYRLKDGKVWT
jgi:lipoprotein-releasing system ATP-binding protein